jgi:Fe2+ transport system protein B
MNAKSILLLSFLSIATCAVTMMAVEKDYAQPSAMSGRIQSNLGKLWDPRGGILPGGFSMQARDNWVESIKELAAYVKKTKAMTISSSYTKLFNDAIQELQVASMDLFNAIQFVKNSQSGRTIAQADDMIIKKERDKLKENKNKLQVLAKKLEEQKSGDYASTKEIKQMILVVFRAFATMNNKAIQELEDMYDAVLLAKIQAGMPSAQAK